MIQGGDFTRGDGTGGNLAHANPRIQLLSGGHASQPIAWLPLGTSGELERGATVGMSGHTAHRDLALKQSLVLGRDGRSEAWLSVI